MDSFAQQGGFAETGRGGDEGEPAMEPRIQLLNQARARHQLGDIVVLFMLSNDLLFQPDGFSLGPLPNIARWVQITS